MHVMPVLETVNPSAKKALSEAAFCVAEDVAFLDSVADEAFDSARCDREKLCALPRAIRLRVLKRLLPYDDYTSADLLRLDALLKGQTGDCATLKCGVVAWLDANRLRFDRKSDEPFLIPVPAMGTVRLPHGTLTVAEAKTAVLPSGGFDAYVDADRIKGETIVRTPQSGDRFNPFGMSGSKLLSDFLTDKKIPRFDRSIPLVCDENGILFVVGHTIDERMRIGASTDHIRHYHYEED
jgi:tRNA(Ile)-lysidine synthase